MSSSFLHLAPLILISKQGPIFLHIFFKATRWRYKGSFTNYDYKRRWVGSQLLEGRKCKWSGVGGQKSQKLVNVVCERPLIWLAEPNRKFTQEFEHEHCCTISFGHISIFVCSIYATRPVEPWGSGEDNYISSKICSIKRPCTGKSLLEALILASTNPQNDKYCSLIYQFSTWKLQAQNMLFTEIVFFCIDIQNNLCTQHVLSL